jgi:hypothetical protein
VVDTELSCECVLRRKHFRFVNEGTFAARDVVVVAQSWSLLRLNR